MTVVTHFPLTVLGVDLWVASVYDSIRYLMRDFGGGCDNINMRVGCGEADFRVNLRTVNFKFATIWRPERALIRIGKTGYQTMNSI